MGSTLDWMEVLCIGALWGALVFIVNLLSRERIRHLDVLILAIGSLLFGMLTTFGWRRSFQWPLLAVTILIISAFIGLAVTQRRTVIVHDQPDDQ